MPNDIIKFPGIATEEEMEVIKPSEITPSNLSQYTEQWLSEVAGDMLKEMKKSILRRLKKDDRYATDQAGQMLGLLKTNTGTVINNVMQASISGVNNDSVQFDSIIRQMDGEDRPKEIIEVRPG